MNYRPLKQRRRSQSSEAIVDRPGRREDSDTTTTADFDQGRSRRDPIYAQTTFPIVIEGDMAIPAGTWVQGVVDNVKRAGRIKGTAELGFHLTQLIYSNGYTLNITAAIDQVPGDESSSVKEPGTVKHDSEKGKDLERIGTGASQGAQIGSISGAVANKGIRGIGVGG
jgi:type IV secretion system protein VirB10